jgi:hypothetical protein
MSDSYLSALYHIVSLICKILLLLHFMTDGLTVDILCFLV